MFSCGVAHCGGGGGLVAVFRDTFASAGGVFILLGEGVAGRWAIILWGLGTFLIYPNFVRF